MTLDPDGPYLYLEQDGTLITAAVGMAGPNGIRIVIVAIKGVDNAELHAADLRRVHIARIRAVMALERAKRMEAQAATYTRPSGLVNPDQPQ